MNILDTSGGQRGGKVQVLPPQKGLKLDLGTTSVLKQGWLCSHTRFVDGCGGGR